MKEILEAVEAAAEKDNTKSKSSDIKGTDLEEFMKYHSLIESEWTESKIGLSFDCAKMKKDFKVDPVKLEKGLYSEVESTLKGKNVGLCC